MHEIAAWQDTKLAVRQCCMAAAQATQICTGPGTGSFTGCFKGMPVPGTLEVMQQRSVQVMPQAQVWLRHKPQTQTPQDLELFHHHRK